MSFRVLYHPTGTEHLTVVPNDNRTYCGRHLFPGRQSWLYWDNERHVSWHPTNVCRACQKIDGQMRWNRSFPWSVRTLLGKGTTMNPVEALDFAIAALNKRHSALWDRVAVDPNRVVRLADEINDLEAALATLRTLREREAAYV